MFPHRAVQKIKLKQASREPTRNTWKQKKKKKDVLVCLQPSESGNFYLDDRIINCFSVRLAGRPMWDWGLAFNFYRKCCSLFQWPKKKHPNKKFPAEMNVLPFRRNVRFLVLLNISHAKSFRYFCVIFTWINCNSVSGIIDIVDIDCPLMALL